MKKRKKPSKKWACEIARIRCLQRTERLACIVDAIRRNQQTTYKIPFFLREIPIAHKTGEDCGIANDVGIVFAKNPFIFCFASNGVDVAAADRLCRDAALEVYNYYNV